MFACVNVGIMFETGRDAPRDYRVAADNYERSCNATSVAGCQLLAEALEYGRGRAKDIARAAERYKRACGAGYTAACTAATRLAAARASTTTSPARE